MGQLSVKYPLKIRQQAAGGCAQHDMCNAASREVIHERVQAARVNLGCDPIEVVQIKAGPSAIGSW